MNDKTPRFWNTLSVLIIGMGCGMIVLLCVVGGFGYVLVRNLMATPTADYSWLTPVSTSPFTDLQLTMTVTPPTEESLPTVTSTAGPDDPTGHIVFTCFNYGFDDICLMSADGSQSLRLTDARATDFYASLGPDGSTIVFSSRREEGFQIYRMNLDGEHQTRLTEKIGSLFAPHISPNGEKIVFANATGGHQGIWVMDIDGSDAKPLTVGAWDDVDPVWSPDGSWISFASSRAGSRQLYVMRADGSDVRKITPNLANMGGRNDWSPDGLSLAFYAGPSQKREIYTINVDGTNLRQLTDGGDNLAPSFSPDGRWITFTSYRDGNNEIYIMRADGTDPTRLTFDPRPDWQPRWGP
jgi:TolB protein